uniref:Uncharacterized protein n=1 Tax=Aegilops tauschii TaxID=37682 RepID=M8C8I7_AEGTA
MVPTTRSQLPSHHDPRGKNSKPPPSYYSGYYIAAQLEEAASAAVDDLKQQQPSRFPRRLAMADDENAEEEAAAGTSSRGGGGDYEDGGNKDWLRLGLGAVASCSSTTTSSSSAGGENDGARAAPMELDLLAGGDGRESARVMSRPPLFPLPIRSYHHQYGHGRGREPILPQIPKSYLRIRDTSMKVEVVLKYLAEKLGLSQSHQIGI